MSQAVTASHNSTQVPIRKKTNINANKRKLTFCQMNSSWNLYHRNMSAKRANLEKHETQNRLNENEQNNESVEQIVYINVIYKLSCSHFLLFTYIFTFFVCMCHFFLAANLLFFCIIITNITAVVLGTIVTDCELHCNLFSTLHIFS